jgi:hypothetical protein
MSIEDRTRETVPVTGSTRTCSTRSRCGRTRGRTRREATARPGRLDQEASTRNASTRRRYATGTCPAVDLITTEIRRHGRYLLGVATAQLTRRGTAVAAPALPVTHRRARCAPCVAHERDLHAAPELPADFWDEVVLREALQSWHMGRVIRAWRTRPYHGRRPAKKLSKR